MRLTPRVPLSCHLCCRPSMAPREKRSVSLPPELAQAIDRAAAGDGTTFSAWLAAAAAHRLRLVAGRGATAEWEHEQGALTPDELADGLARARSLLGRRTGGPSSRRSA